MPEGFLKDETIGVKWKIYAIVNGFWVSGKTCWGGNKFFAEQLGVSERQIRNGMNQLEEDGYIRREIKGNIRYVYPAGKVVEAEVPVPRGGTPASAEAEVPVPHISDSISVNTISESPIRVESEDTKIPKPKKDVEYRKVFELFQNRQANWIGNRTEIAAAQNLLAEQTWEDIESAMRYVRKHSLDPYFPQITKPSELDRKWNNLEAYYNKHDKVRR